MRRLHACRPDRRIFRRIVCVGLWTVFITLAACAPSNIYVAKDFRPLLKIALLPMANDSNDLDAPVFVRQVIYNQMRTRGYDLVPLDQIDAKLKEQGFTDGGQLRATTPQKLAEWTGADTLFYTTVEDFNYIILGYYWQRNVKLTGRLVDAKSGERLWEATRSQSTRGVATNKKQAEQVAAVQLAIKMAEKLAHRPLQAETQVAVNSLLMSIPAR